LTKIRARGGAVRSGTALQAGGFISASS